jgi:hypothetical protein
MGIGVDGLHSPRDITLARLLLQPLRDVAAGASAEARQGNAASL